jgi:hypothetical protein
VYSLFLYTYAVAAKQRKMTDFDEFQEDGWDDDVDDLDLDETLDHIEESTLLVETTLSAMQVHVHVDLPPLPTKEEWEGDEGIDIIDIDSAPAEGWGEDEDLFFDESESSNVVKEVAPVSVSVAPKPPPPKPPVSTFTSTSTARSAAPVKMVLPPPPPPPPEAAKDPSPSNEGWGANGDDLSLEDSETTDAHENITQQQQQQPGKAPVVQKLSINDANDDDDDDLNADGWDDDADLTFDDVVGEELEPRRDVPPSGTATRPPSHPPPPPKKLEHTPSPLYTALEDYLLQLPRLQSSINAVLEYECNTLEKATELVQYYSERPGLTDYTIEKELPRMEYTLMQGPSAVTDKKEIARCLKADSSSLVSRCANQSLLADLLQVFTGPDLLVRPQFMAAAIAQSCRFRLDQSQSLVQVQAQLDLCLPTENGRWKVAELQIRIAFCSLPGKPFVEYRLESIRPTVQPNDPVWQSQLQSVAEMLGHLNPQEEDDYNTAGDDNNFRDVFLQQSQSIFSNSAVGMRSAWQEIDNVAGFSNKLSRLPGLNDVMQAAEQAAEAQPMSSTRDRPTSILGGFFGKLAKSVALPDEDPSMYQDWQAPPPAAAAAQPPAFYNRSPPPAASATSATRLYMKDTPPKPQRPSLYNKTTPPPAARPTVQLPKLYNETPGRPSRGPPQPPIAPPQPPAPQARPPPQPPSGPISSSSNVKPPPPPPPLPEPPVEDGWDDELDLDVEDESVSSAPVSSPTKPHSPVPVANKLPPPPSIDDHDDWVYNPANDIIPTRKRWINPRSGNRQL